MARVKVVLQECVSDKLVKKVLLLGTKRLGEHLHNCMASICHVCSHARSNEIQDDAGHQSVSQSSLQAATAAGWDGLGELSWNTKTKKR